MSIACMEFPGLLINPPAVFTDFHSLAIVPLIGCHQFAAAVAMPVVLPIQKTIIYKQACCLLVNGLCG